ncbi:exosome non-catalytic core subunit RRP46 [Sporobolomyces salmoneus]|uniref:exosome non-catalytic core subunit RRP46 n=1 Tax=Sporobolomyces salmoneus TaxID=183962 RepID=UPI0031704A07
MTARTDRTATSLRPLAITQSVLSRSDGSAQFFFGNVVVLSSVTGPTEVRLREELVDRSTLEFNVLPLIGLPGPRVKAIEETIRSLFSPLILSNLYPRSLIQITTQTISSPSTAFGEDFSTTLDSEDEETRRKRRRKNVTGSGASEQAARINSITLALLDSGVQLKGLLIAVAVAFIPSSTETGEEEEEDGETEMVLDPTVQEEERAESTHVVTVSYGEGIGGKDGEVVGVESKGRFTQNQLFDAEDLAVKATATVLGFVRKSVEAKYGIDPSASSTSTTEVEEKKGAGGEIKMCVAEEGREMSDPEEDDEDEVMI